MDNKKYELWLSTLYRIKREHVKLLMEHFGDAEAVYSAGEAELQNVDGISGQVVEELMNKDLSKAEDIIRACEKTGCSIINISSTEYPDRLRHIFDPPVVLYVRGKLPKVDDMPVVGIVGTRNCTPYGYKNTEKIAYALSKRGITVTTGLARGIDTAAAIGASNGKMPVIGVIGCGADQVYPAQNKKLFEKVASTGAIVSEYPPGTIARPEFFPARNRIISGLSLGVAVIEAPKRSGALITAERAIEHGRDVFVLPGNVDSAACEGSNKLLRLGAIPFMTADDIIDEYIDFYPELQKSIDKKDTVDYIGLNKLNVTEKSIVKFIGNKSMYADEIITGTGLETPAALAALTGLEISGYIERDSTNHYALSNYL